jgi:transcriptional regulator NrdR family protein
MSACPTCGSFDSVVYDSRPLQNGWTRRRRRCKIDDHRWVSYELPSVELDVSERDPYELREVGKRRGEDDQTERTAVRADGEDAA